MRFGVFLPSFIVPGRERTHPVDIRAFARRAEELGFDSLWVVDHLLYKLQGEARPRGVWEAWSLLSALAATTRRVELGTLVLAMGEMGRTPRWNDPRVRGTSYQPGRDHWVNCMFALMAGGGVRGGQVYGASDRISAYPAEKPVWPGDIAATVYHKLGIPTDLIAQAPDGRPVRLIEGHPIKEWV